MGATNRAVSAFNGCRLGGRSQNWRYTDPRAIAAAKRQCSNGVEVEIHRPIIRAFHVGPCLVCRGLVRAHQVTARRHFITVLCCARSAREGYAGGLMLPNAQKSAPGIPLSGRGPLQASRTNYRASAGEHSRNFSPIRVTLGGDFCAFGSMRRPGSPEWAGETAEECYPWRTTKRPGQTGL